MLLLPEENVETAQEIVPDRGCRSRDLGPNDGHRPTTPGWPRLAWDTLEAAGPIGSHVSLC